MNQLKACQSDKLKELLNRFGRDAHFKVTEDTLSPWIEFDVFGKYGWVRFAIWKSTDELYALNIHGAVGDDPISVPAAVSYVVLGITDDQG